LPFHVLVTHHELRRDEGPFISMPPRCANGESLQCIQELQRASEERSETAAPDFSRGRVGAVEWPIASRGAGGRFFDVRFKHARMNLRCAAAGSEAGRERRGAAWVSLHVLLVALQRTSTGCSAELQYSCSRAVDPSSGSRYRVLARSSGWRQTR